ncbi:MAG: GIY-YIG nuclease family protein [Candidatus Zambryskibacteria bacterium]|nr:GIY-YIG nuclease family protein [Candidatus Zambryskibacteria bacterium]
MYYVYLLRSKKQPWIYVGYTTNLRRRIAEHQKGFSLATKPYKPFDLLFYEAYKSLSDAKRRESYFKTNQGKRALKIMLSDTLKN